MRQGFQLRENTKKQANGFCFSRALHHHLTSACLRRRRRHLNPCHVQQNDIIKLLPLLIKHNLTLMLLLFRPPPPPPQGVY